MDLEQAIKNALDGNAILFLGSGASFGAVNQNNVTMGVGEDLAKKIYPGVSDLQQATELFIDEKNNEHKDGELELISFLKKEFYSTAITEDQSKLSIIPWKRIYTTNYDDVIERAYMESSKPILSVTTDDNASDYLSCSELVYLHINGYIKKLNKSTLQNSFKLSSTSYNTDSFTNSKWGTLFQNDLDAYASVIFIGFSMKYDLDIRRIVYKKDSSKCIFIVWENEPDANIRFLSKYGKVYPIGIKGFIQKVQDIKRTYHPLVISKLEDVALTNFRKYDRAPSLSSPSDSEVLNYYTRGSRSQNLYYNKGGKYTSIIWRDCIKSIIKNINNGIKAIFIHSDIGNGKTETLEQICLSLCNIYSIYSLVDYNEKISKEIELICKSTSKMIVIIENFYNYYDVLKIFELYGDNDNITFIFTARTSIYRSRYESFSFSSMKVYDLNRLNNIEIENMVEVFKRYGFYSIETKNIYDHIYSQCNRKLQSVMLSIFDNEIITSNIKSICKSTLIPQNKYFELLLFLITVKVMSLSINFKDALNLLQIYSYDYDFEKDSNLNELLDWDNDSASIKSPALCTWILKNNNFASYVFDILIKAAQKADSAYDVNAKYRNFLGNIISYKHLKFILELFNLTLNEKLITINNFYERIKEYDFYKDKYYFWLQYAISSLEMKDYSSSEMHFKAAYANIPDSMQPFEIDNQYARLKIELLLLPDYCYCTNTILEIQEIDKLLTPSTIKSDEKFYSYKMAYSYYRKLYDKFYSLFNDTEKKAFNSITKNKYNYCQKYIKENRNIAFQSQLNLFAKEFGSLAFCKSTYDFHIMKIFQHYVIGYIIMDGKKINAQYHRTNSQRISVKIGDKKEAMIIGYNSKYHRYELKIL